MENFSKKLDVSDFENNIFENKAKNKTGIQLTVIVTQLFWSFLVEMPLSFQNFCKNSHSKIAVYMEYSIFNVKRKYTYTYVCLILL